MSRILSTTWCGDHLTVTWLGQKMTSKIVSPFQKVCFLIPRLPLLTAPDHILYYFKSILTLILHELYIRTNKTKGKHVAFSRKKTVIFVVKNQIRSFLLPHEGNLFCSCPKHWQTAGHYKQGLAEQSGMTGSYVAVDKFDVEQVETVSNKWGAQRTEKHKHRCVIAATGT